MTLLNTGPGSAERNMEIDRDLLEKVATLDRPLLHLYRWKEKAATYGHFIAPEKLLDLPNCRAIGLDLGKRPTGGGVIFHTHDLAFSLLVPASHPLYGRTPIESYRNIHTLVMEALKPFIKESLSLLPDEPSSVALPYCMAGPTRYDLLQKGKKVGGAAQRRTKAGLLHQGSLFLHLPPLEWMAPLVPAAILAAIEQESSPLFDAHLPLHHLQLEVEQSLFTTLKKFG